MLSKHTAFIAVNENNKAIESEMQTRDVNKLEEYAIKKGDKKNKNKNKNRNINISIRRKVKTNKQKRRRRILIIDFRAQRMKSQNVTLHFIKVCLPSLLPPLFLPLPPSSSFFLPSFSLLPPTPSSLLFNY